MTENLLFDWSIYFLIFKIFCLIDQFIWQFLFIDWLIFLQWHLVLSLGVQAQWQRNISGCPYSRPSKTKWKGGFEKCLNKHRYQHADTHDSFVDSLCKSFFYVLGIRDFVFFDYLVFVFLTSHITIQIFFIKIKFWLIMISVSQQRVWYLPYWRYDINRIRFWTTESTSIS